MIRRLAPALLALPMLAACGSVAAVASAPPAAPHVAKVRPSPFPCHLVTGALLQQIEGGMVDGETINSGEAVRTGDPEHPWIIALHVQGGTLVDEPRTAVFAAKTIKGYAPAIYAVDVESPGGYAIATFQPAGPVSSDAVAAARTCLG